MIDISNLFNLLTGEATVQPTPIKLLFSGEYLDGSLQVAQSKLDKSHIMFSFESYDIQFSGETTLNSSSGEVSREDMQHLMNMIAGQYYNRLMYTKEELIKNGQYIH